jgi:hypothetical protein
VLGSRSGFERFVGESAATRRVLALARRAAGSDLPALLLGPTGNRQGDSWRARIHAASDRSQKSLVVLNCALPDQPKRCSRASSSVTCAARSPAAMTTNRGSSRSRTGARSSSTSSPSCRAARKARC